MEILKPALAGTLESSDTQVMVEPNEEGLVVQIESSVINQYGRQIYKTVLETAKALGVENAKIFVVDKGALDCIIKARVECALLRGCESSSKNVPWRGAVK